MPEAVATSEGSTARNTRSEAEVRKLIDDWTNALRAKRPDAMKAFYAPDVVYYDALAPLQLDRDIYWKYWGEYFSMFPGPVKWDSRGLTMAAGEDVAFTYALVNLTGTDAEGKEQGAWMRQTVGYTKINGKWVITHEHWSFPMDMESSKALSNLKPE